MPELNGILRTPVRQHGQIHCLGPGYTSFYRHYLFDLDFDLDLHGNLDRLLDDLLLLYLYDHLFLYDDLFDDLLGHHPFDRDFLDDLLNLRLGYDLGFTTTGERRRRRHAKNSRFDDSAPGHVPSIHGSPKSKYPWICVTWTTL